MRSLEELKPQDFASMGLPCSSCWGKVELEWIALAYVSALAAAGNEWRTLGRKQVYPLLCAELQERVYTYFHMDFEPYQRWFEVVRRKIGSAQGAADVGGFWRSKLDEVRRL